MFLCTKHINKSIIDGSSGMKPYEVDPSLKEDDIFFRKTVQ